MIIQVEIWCLLLLLQFQLASWPRPKRQSAVTGFLQIQVHYLHVLESNENPQKSLHPIPTPTKCNLQFSSLGRLPDFWVHLTSCASKMMTTFSAVLGIEYGWVSDSPGMDSLFLMLYFSKGGWCWWLPSWRNMQRKAWLIQFLEISLLALWVHHDLKQAYSAPITKFLTSGYEDVSSRL